MGAPRSAWDGRGVSAYLYLILALLFWSGNFILGKLLVDVFPPVALTAIRWTIGLVVLLPVVLRPPGLPRVERVHWPALVLLGFIGMVLYPVLVYVAVRYTTTVNASLIQAAIPTVTVLMAVLLFRDRVAVRQWLGIVVAFAGVAWVVAEGRPVTLATLGFNVGDLLMLVNVFAWAIYTIVAQRVMRYYSALGVTFYLVVIGLLFLYPAALWEMQGRALSPLTLPIALALLYLGVFPSVLSYVFWNKGVEMIGASKASMTINLIPVFTAVLAALFLDERIGLHHVVGGLTVALGVYLGTRPSRSAVEPAISSSVPTKTS